MNTHLKLTLCGAPTIILAEQPLSHTLTPKALALFTYLVVTRRPHTRDTLAYLLWDELPNQQARNNLRYTLSDLRQVVGDYLTINTQTIGFNQQAPYWLDVEVLQTLFENKPADADQERATTVAPQALENALALYQGEFLAGFTVRNAPVFEEWVISQRGMLHTIAIQGFYQLAEHYWQAGDYHAGLATTQRLLFFEPGHEAAHRLRMALFAHSGQRAAALAQFTLCQQNLASELAVQPEAATVALYEQIRSGLYNKQQLSNVLPVERDSFITSAPDKSSAPHNLPGQLTPLIGRQQEIADLSDLLINSDSRLITLIGEGGVGKTRLALAVAQAILEFRFPIISSEPTSQNMQKFPNGVWFVSLADINTENDSLNAIAIAIAEALNFRLVGSEQPVQQLLNHVRHQRLLLLLDNFEHLVEDAGLVLDFLRSASAVKLLVTSRQCLDFQAEIVWRVDGLSVPTVEQARTLSEVALLQFESIALFVERARRRQRTFALTIENRNAVLHICHLVEGLPLAIELAAAQLYQHTCAELVESLQAGYNLLTTTLHDLLPRHRSLQAVLLYSWQLLSETEQEVLAACSVFQGGFTPITVAAIVQASPTVLYALEDKSFLRRSDNQRFTMHTFVQQFATIQHTKRSDAKSIFYRHSRYFLTQMAEQGLTDRSTQANRDQLRYELANIRQAWQCAVQQENLALLEQSLTAVIEFFRRAGLLQELETHLAHATTCIRQQLSGFRAESTIAAYGLLGRLLVEQAFFSFLLGRGKLAYNLAEEGVQIAEKYQIAGIAAAGYLSLNLIAEWRGNFSAKYKFATASVTWAQRAQLPQTEARGLSNIGMALLYDGKVADSLTYFHRTLLLAQIHDSFIESQCLGNLSLANLCLGNFDTAQQYQIQALRLSDQFEFIGSRAWAILIAGEYYLRLGDSAQAEQLLAEALDIYAAIGPRILECIAAQRLSRLFCLRQDLVPALDYAKKAVALAQEYDIQFWHAPALAAVGHVLSNSGRWAEADIAFQSSLVIGQQIDNNIDCLMAAVGLAVVRLAQEDWAGAYQQLNQWWPLPATLHQNPRAEPELVWLLFYRVFAKQLDARAEEILRTAYVTLQALGSKIADEGLRQSFFEKVAINRDLLAWAQMSGIP